MPIFVLGILYLEVTTSNSSAAIPLSECIFNYKAIPHETIFFSPRTNDYCWIYDSFVIDATHRFYMCKWIFEGLFHDAAIYTDHAFRFTWEITQRTHRLWYLTDWTEPFQYRFPNKIQPTLMQYLEECHRIKIYRDALPDFYDYPFTYDDITDAMYKSPIKEIQKL